MIISSKQFFLPLLIIVASLAFTQCSGEKVNFILRSTADEINKTCPEVLDDFLRLDSCQALPNKILRYNYTVLSESEEFFSESNLDIFKVQAFFDLRSIIQETENDLKFLMDMKTTFQYAYFDTKGKELFVTSVSPEEYNKVQDMQSDEYVHTEINRIYNGIKSQLPTIDEEETFSHADLIYPRTLVYHIQKNKWVKPTSFDSISFKNTEKEIALLTLSDNIFNDLLPYANINYVYKYTDKDGNYLCTLDISPKDYQ